MSSRIEQIIEEIEEYVDSCKYQPLSTTKIVVNKEEIEELLRELRLKTPDEIKRYQKIISNKDGSVLTQTLEDAGGKYKGFIDALQACMDVVNHNRQELAPQTAQAAAMSGSYQPADTEASKEDEALLDEIGDN